MRHSSGLNSTLGGPNTYDPSSGWASGSDNQSKGPPRRGTERLGRKGGPQIRRHARNNGAPTPRRPDRNRARTGWVRGRVSQSPIRSERSRCANKRAISSHVYQADPPNGRVRSSFCATGLLSWRKKEPKVADRMSSGRAPWARNWRKRARKEAASASIQVEN